MSARMMLTICFWGSLAFDVAAGTALWCGKPWWVVLGLIVLGCASHPGSQPTLRTMAENERGAK